MPNIYQTFGASAKKTPFSNIRNEINECINKICMLVFVYEYFNKNLFKKYEKLSNVHVG